MIINQMLVNRFQTDDGKIFTPKLLSIGTWNMDTLNNKVVSHGLGVDVKYAFCIGMNIYSDAGLVHTMPFSDPLTPDYDMHVFIGAISSTTLNVFRKAGGFFDHVDYSDPGVERGNILLLYWENP